MPVAPRPGGPSALTDISAPAPSSPVGDTRHLAPTLWPLEATMGGSAAGTAGKPAPFNGGPERGLGGGLAAGAAAKKRRT